MEGYIVSLIIFTAIFALFGLGLNLQWGFTGLINFGHVAFMAVGAYVTVLLSDLEVPIPPLIWLVICVLIGSSFSALLGLLIGLSTVRLREDYLAIVTIGVSEMVRLVALNEEWLTRGSFGVQGFPLPLQGFAPTLLTRIGMLALFTSVIALGYWQLWKWLRQQLKGISRQSIAKSALAVSGYLGSLSLLLYGTVVGARQLKLAEGVPAWMLGLFLLGAVVAIVSLYTWLARQTIPRLPDWSAGLSLVSFLLCLAAGLWVYQFAAHAIYTYSRTSIKTGLMFISVLVLALIFWGLQKLVRSPWGRVLKAIREDEEVAKALGKNVFWYKLQALMLGGLVAGVAGALYAWQLTTIYPDNFQPLVTFNAWTIVVLGGAGNNVGTLLGAAIFWAYQTLTRFILADIIPLDDARLGAFRIMIIGLLLMVLMVWRPQGILGKKEELTLGR
jgi:neutral amino acid transport system permease protein